MECIHMNARVIVTCRQGQLQKLDDRCNACLPNHRQCTGCELTHKGQLVTSTKDKGALSAMAWHVGLKFKLRTPAHSCL